MDDLRTRPQATPLLERDEELAAIREALPTGSTRSGRLFIVEGGPGLGKSRLLAATAALGESAGLRVLAARSGEPERDFPFGVARQLFEPQLADVDADERARLLDGAAGLAAPLFDETRWGRTLRDDDDALFPLLHGLFWLTHNLAHDAPLLMHVDDLHWADASSLRFLLYLAQRLDGLPLVIAASARPLEAQARNELIDDLRAQPACTRIPLRPLSGEAVARIVRESVFPDAEDTFCRACAEATAGNPFLLVELLGVLAADEVPPTAAGAAAVRATSPETVARRVLLRLRKLSPSAFALARAAAVAGDGAPLRHAAALAALDPDEAAAAADKLAAAEILTPGEPACFVHPVVRSAVYADIPAGGRARSHLRLARVLASEAAPAGRTAAHLLRAQHGGEPWVAETLAAAAERALAAGAPEAAAGYLRRALEEPPAPEARPELLIALGRAEFANGDPRAFDRFEEALALLDDDQRAAEVLFLLGRRLYVLGRFADAADAFDRGLARAGPAAGGSELATQLEAGYVSAARLDVSLRAAAAERLETLLERRQDGSSGMESVLLAQLAFERVTGGHARDEVVALARRALANGDLLAGGKGEGVAYYSAVGALGYADELTEASAALDRAIDVARDRGSIVAFTRALHFRAYVLYRQGELADAMADIAVVLEHAADGVSVGGPAAEALLATVLVEQGKREDAERTLEIEGVEQRWGATAPYLYFLAARARVALAAGRAAAALDDLRAAGELLSALRVTNPSLVPWRSDAAVAAHRLGELEEARRLADEEVALARAFGAPRALGIALRAKGLVEEGGAGSRTLTEAAEVLARSPARLEQARTLTDLGASLRRMNRRADARGPLRQGLELAERCGAWMLRDHAREELAATGARVAQPATRGTDALTPSERRVATMAAEGMSNKEIAQALFVTVKAVEWHLSNAYRKLEISSRRELSAALDHGGD